MRRRNASRARQACIEIPTAKDAKDAEEKAVLPLISQMSA
jgi:hypothetical protein